MFVLFVVMLFVGVVVSWNGFVVIGFDLVWYVVCVNFMIVWYIFVIS